jgi:hypothetical protein
VNSLGSLIKKNENELARRDYFSLPARFGF